MTAESQVRILRKLPWRTKIKEAQSMLKRKEQIIALRRSEQLGLKMQHALFVSQAYTCNKILKGL